MALNFTFCLPGSLWAQWVATGCSPTGSYCLTSGNAGIGTNSPGFPLQIEGYNPGSGSPDAGIILALVNATTSGNGATMLLSLANVNDWSIGLPAGSTDFAFISAPDSGSPAERMRITSGGNVGIGTPTPGAMFEVSNAAGGGVPIVAIDSAAGINDGFGTGYIGFNLVRNLSAGSWATVPDGANNAGAAVYGGIAGGLRFVTVPSTGDTGNSVADTAIRDTYTRMFIDGGGRVGIGTTDPCTTDFPSNCKLSVAGGIQAQEIVVNTGWSDYVFAPDYALTPLRDVAAYVKENHHLPDIPSAAEVQEKGVSLGDMQAKLLAKIEELTLHMIEAERENRDLRDQVRKLAESISGSERRKVNQ